MGRWGNVRAKKKRGESSKFHEGGLAKRREGEKRGAGKERKGEEW